MTTENTNTEADDANHGRKLLADYAAALRPLLLDLVEPYRQSNPESYATFGAQLADGSTQLHFNLILSNKPAEGVLRMVREDMVAPIAVVTFDGGILTLRPDGIDLN